ncbi:MAG: SRPBCC family protein [Microbacteriaceae bacterium]|nr:SRPBCC family protein [Microbacteriaceae bacterium]
MTRIDIRLDLAHSIDHVWGHLTDWESHSAWIPNTVVTVTTPTVGVGTEFVGVSRIGRLRLDDTMSVTEFEPPAGGTASCVVTKTGQVLGGTAGFTLTTLNDSSTRLDWFEDVYLKPSWLFWWTAPFVLVVGTIAFRSALKAFTRTL